MRIDLSPFQSPCEPMTSNVFPDTILEKKHERFGWVFMKLHTHTKYVMYVEYCAQNCAQVLNRNGVALMFVQLGTDCSATVRHRHAVQLQWQQPRSSAAATNPISAATNAYENKLFTFYHFFVSTDCML